MLHLGVAFAGVLIPEVIESFVSPSDSLVN